METDKIIDPKVQEQLIMELTEENRKLISKIKKHKRHEKELLKAKLKSDETTKVKSEFLANMSHEIRTPMNGIIGLTKLLLNTELSVKQAEYINAIVTSSDALLVIINDILDISKIEAGKMTFDEKDFRIVDLIASVIDLFEGKAAEKKVSLDSHIEPDVPVVLIGDSVRLTQVLFNLIGNAIKFTEHGLITLSVEKIKESEDCISLKFSVSDSGIGISEDKIESIFSAFSQVTSKSTREYGGTGLGLTIVKRIVELQGGSIHVESEPGVGSTFTFCIDYKKSQNLLMRKSNAYKMAGNKQEVVKYLYGFKVLLAEDNTINQLVTNTLLSDLNMTVDIANNGEEALELFDSNEYDIVLMDMQMPKIDGYEAMSTIRSSDQKEKSGIPIIALTAHALDGEEEKCKNAGADDYISKPFIPDELFEKMAHNISSHQIRKNGQSGSVVKDNHDIYLKEFNLKNLEQFSNGNDELVQSTLRIVDDTLFIDVDQLVNAYESGDFERMKNITHKIKPNFILIGMQKIHTCCVAIEKNESPELLEHYIGIIKAVAPLIKKYIKREMKDLKMTS